MPIFHLKVSILLMFIHSRTRYRPRLYPRFLPIFRLYLMYHRSSCPYVFLDHFPDSITNTQLQCNQSKSHVPIPVFLPVFLKFFLSLFPATGFQFLPCIFLGILLGPTLALIVFWTVLHFTPGYTVGSSELCMTICCLFSASGP